MISLERDTCGKDTRIEMLDLFNTASQMFEDGVGEGDLMG